MSWRSVRAVLAGALTAIVLTTLVDVALHAAGVYPPLDARLNDAQSLLATAYRVVIGIGA